MRVYQVLAPARFGGAETVCLSLSAALGGAGIECALVLLVDAEVPDALLARAERLGVPTVVLRHGRRGYHRDAWALSRLVARDVGAILHSHLARANLAARAAAALSRRPCVATLHGHFGSAARHRLYDAADLAVLRTMDAVISVSHTTAAEMRRRSPRRADRVLAVPSALLPDAAATREDARDELGVAREGTVVGWVGRFAAQKRPELFVACVAEAARRASLPDPWRVVMVGDGPLLAATRELAASLGVADRITFSGFRPDAGRLASAFDVLAITSRGEELPTVMLECLHRGVPVVSTPVGDVPRVAGRCGAVRVCEATAAAFAEALAGVAAAAGRPALARLATAYAAGEYDLATWAERHRALYARLLEPGRGRARAAEPQLRRGGS